MTVHSQVARRLLECFLRSLSIAELARHLEHDANLRDACRWIEVEPLLHSLEVASLEECIAILSAFPRCTLRWHR